MAITRIGNPAIADQRGINFRNIIINGGMDIAQRGTSESGVTSSGYYTCDRWRTGLSIGTWTQSQSTDVPSGQGFANSFKLDCTTADAAPAAGDFFQFLQKVEGQNLQYLKKGTANAESLTASFWVKSNKTGTYILELDDNDNARSISQSYTINTADTWEKKTLTFDGDTIGTLDNDNADSFRILFWLAAGTDFTSGTLQTSWQSTVNANRAVGQVNLADSTSNEWYITGVQLEAGQVASDFEFLPFDVNIIRCKRYFQILGPDGAGNGENALVGCYNTTQLLIAWYTFPVRMRAGPSLTFSAVSDFDLEPFDVAPTALSTFASRPDQICVQGTDPSVRTRGFGGAICMDTAGGYIQMSAEL